MSLDGAVLGIQLIAMDRQQLAAAKHGDQGELDRQPCPAVPRHILAVEAVPRRLDLIFGKDALAGIFLVERQQVDARGRGDVVAAILSAMCGSKTLW
jgi:hypothetical protein